MKRALAFLLAALFAAVLFTGCFRVVTADDPVSVTKAPSTKAPATKAPMTQPPETQAPATETPVTEAPATEEPAAEESPAPEPVPAEPEEDPGVYLDLDGMNVIGTAPFAEGIGWVQYADRTEVYTSAVEPDGHVLFTVTGPVLYVSPFENGTAFIVYADNAFGYEPNSSRKYYVYALQKADSACHEVIVDTAGKELYTTSAVDTTRSHEEEHILCGGGGKFVVLRHQSGLEYNGWTMGTINAAGETVDAFQSYSGKISEYYSYTVGSGMLPEWADDYYDSQIQLKNSYLTYNKSDVAGYLGEGVYYIPGYPNMLYIPAKGIVVPTSHSARVIGEVHNGKVLSYDSGTASYYREYTDGVTESEYLNRILDAYQYIDPDRLPIGTRMRFYTYSFFRKRMTGNRYYHDHAYFDMEMNRVVEITDYPELDMEGSAFSDGYALLRLLGKDGNLYVTVIDENGTVQFEPFKITDGEKSLSPGISNGFFVANDGDDCAVYDIHGNYIRHICSGQDVNSMPMISGGYVLFQMSSRSSGQGMELVLYRLNPEG